MNVYTKIDGKLAVFAVETDDYELAIKAIRDHLTLKHRTPIFAVVVGGKN